MLRNAVRDVWVAVAQGVERKKRKKNGGGGDAAAAKWCLQQECEGCNIFGKMPNSIILKN